MINYPKSIYVTTLKNQIFLRSHSNNKTSNGMGLGLSLVKKIVDTFNGKIWVEDKIKGDQSIGSNFILMIPESPSNSSKID